MADVIAKLRIDSKEYDSKIERARSGMLHLEQSLKQAGKSFKDADQDQVAFVRSLGSMETVARTTKGRIAELTKAYTDLSIQYKHLSDAEKQSEPGRALASSLQQLKTRIETTKKDLADVSSELGGTTASTNDFSGAVGALTSQLGINGNMLSTITSGTIGYTAAIGAVATAAIAASKAFADYNSELAQQDNITTVTTGLKGGDAEQMTSSMRALSKTYDVDFREAINAANTLMSQFGVSGSEAIKLLRDGMQGMIQGDGPKLLSMIQQYAPSFRDAGISASQLVAIIQNSEGGIFTDENMNAIVMGIRNIRHQTKATQEAMSALGIDGKKMSQQLNDGSLTVFEALQQVAGAIDNVGSGSEAAGAIMQSVFGRQGTMAGTKLGEAIATLNTNLEETKNQTGELGEAFVKLEQANERLEYAMRNTFEYDGWQTMSTGIKTELTDALTGLYKVLGDVRGMLEKMGVSGVDAITSIASSIPQLTAPLATTIAALKALSSYGGQQDTVQTIRSTSVTPGSKTGTQQVVESVIGSINPNPVSPRQQQPTQPTTNPPTNPDPNKTKGTTPVQQAQDLVDKALLDYQASIKKAQLEMESGLKSETDVQRTTLAAQEKLYDAYGKAYATYADPKYKEAQDAAAAEIVRLGGEVKTVTEQQKKVEQAARELEAAQKKLSEARRALSVARESGHLKDIYAAEKKVTAAQEDVTRLETIKVNVEQGIVDLPNIPTDDQTIRVNLEEGEVNLPDIPKDDQTIHVNIEATTDNVSSAIAKMKEDLGGMQVGSLAFNMEQENLVDMTTLQTIIGEQLKNGLQIDPTISQDLFSQILNGDNIDDSVWEGIVNTINAKLKEMEIDPINIDFNTGKLKDANKDAKATKTEFSAAASAISSLGGALQQIEDPAAKVAGMIAQAIASVALTFATSLKGTVTPWDWIAASIAGTATMISTIAAIKSATAGSYARGGIVDGSGGGFVGGTAYSGDNIGNVRLDAGELVLNRAQQSTLAGELEGNAALANLTLDTIITGEDIRVVLSRNSRRRGYGEYVTTKNG